ncbi:MAG: GDSL family lipase [Alteromonadaceae bacterium]|nr:GDSL family lipase [Alteromonadaceae bacterium]
MTAIVLLLSGCAVTPQTHESATSWTTTWATATEDIREGFWMSKGHFPPMPLKDNTLRMFMRTSIGGSTVRVKFSNAFGTTPITIQSAHLAQAKTANASETNGAIDISTDTPLTFSGAATVTIAPGETLYSDQVDFPLTPLEVVAISIHYGNIAQKPITGHRGARTTSFFAEGNTVSSQAMGDVTTKDVWYTATAIEVLAPTAGKTVVAMGDSITDGYGTRYNYHTRWTDYLAERLQNNPDTAAVAMANMGIGGAGAAMSIDRFERDVAQIKGAGWLVIFIGINDIVYGDNRDASYLINQYKEMAELARGQGLAVIGATITPMGDHSKKAGKEATRQAVNNWIRATALQDNIYDSVIDFDKIVRDPKRPAYLLPDYAVDDLHLNITGYQAMADAVDLTLFK